MINEASYAPTTETPSRNVVAALTGIWEKILDTQNITPTQDFFDLGGNSVLMIAMLELVQREFGQEIDIGKLVDMGAAGVTVELVAQLLC